MKKIIRVILVIFVLLTVSGCRKIDKDKIEYTLSKDESYYVLSYVGENIEELGIPEYYNGKPVLEIGDFACCKYVHPTSHNRSKLKSVKIEAKLTKIGDSAFKECIFLETINIPQTVIEIGAGAFSMCKSLKSVEIPTGVTQISESLFMECEKLESITLHDKIVKVKINIKNSPNEQSEVLWKDETNECKLILVYEGLTKDEKQILGYIR